MAHLLMPRLPDVQLHRPAQARSTSRRIHIEPYPILVLSVVHAQRTLREAGGADGGATLMKRRRRVLIKDAALAIIIALALFGAWKLIAWLAGVGVTP